MADKPNSDPTDSPEDTISTTPIPDAESPSTAFLSTKSHGACVSASSMHNAWPVQDSLMSPRQITAGRNKAVDPDDSSTATPLVSAPGSNNDEGAKPLNRIIEEYVPHDSKGRSQIAQNSVPNLKRRLEGFKTAEGRQRELHGILCVEEDGVSNDSSKYLAYLSQNPGDIPENPVFDRKLNARIWNPATIGCYKEERPFNIAERQQEHFRGWSWPRREDFDEDELSTPKWPMRLGPKYERVTVTANPPPGSTWQSIAIEQRANAAQDWPISEGPKSEYVRMLVDPPAGSSWEDIANEQEQEQNAAAFKERTDSESP